MEVKAYLKNYRQSPRKVRLLADFVRGKAVVSALGELQFMNKRAVSPITKLLKSAVANAKHNFRLTAENLFVKEARVDEGRVLKRHMPRAFGRAFPIKKRTSHVTIVLEERQKSEARNPK